MVLATTGTPATPATVMASAPAPTRALMSAGRSIMVCQAWPTATVRRAVVRSTTSTAGLVSGTARPVATVPTTATGTRVIIPALVWRRARRVARQEPQWRTWRDTIFRSRESASWSATRSSDSFMVTHRSPAARSRCQACRRFLARTIERSTLRSVKPVITPISARLTPAVRSSRHTRSASFRVVMASCRVR